MSQFSQPEFLCQSAAERRCIGPEHQPTTPCWHLSTIYYLYWRWEAAPHLAIIYTTTKQYHAAVRFCMHKYCSRLNIVPVHKIIKAQGRRHFHADIIPIPRQIKIFFYFIHLLYFHWPSFSVEPIQKTRLIAVVYKYYLLLIIIVIETPRDVHGNHPGHHTPHPPYTFLLRPCLLLQIVGTQGLNNI